MIPASSFGALNHVTVANLNAASAAVGMSAFGGRPKNIRSEHYRKRAIEWLDHQVFGRAA
jgi:hypothetical protein